MVLAPLTPAPLATFCHSQLLNRTMGNFHSFLLVSTEIMVGVAQIPLRRFKGMDGFMDCRATLGHRDS